jgi:hypothetical protein
MKKIAVLLSLGLTLTFAACHYGTEEAQKTLETNQEYKNDKSEYSVNKANVAIPEESPASADTAASALKDTAVTVK